MSLGRNDLNMDIIDSLIKRGFFFNQEGIAEYRGDNAFFGHKAADTLLKEEGFKVVYRTYDFDVLRTKYSNGEKEIYLSAFPNEIKSFVTVSNVVEL